MSEAQFNPFDSSSYSNTPVEVPQEAVETDVQTQLEAQESQEVQSTVSSDTAVELPQESQTNEQYQSEPVQFEWPNEVAKDIYDKLVNGNISELADMIYEQKVLSSLDSMDESDIIKLQMAYEYPDLTPEEIEEEFNSVVDEKPKKEKSPSSSQS
jgi:hypothetical protein